MTKENRRRARIVGCVACICTALAVDAAGPPPNCYVIKNESRNTVYLEFEYNRDIVPDMPFSLELYPGGVYPTSGSWCFKDPRLKAVVHYSPGVASWSGELVLGTAPSGTYSVRSENVKAKAGGAKATQ